MEREILDDPAVMRVDGLPEPGFLSFDFHRSRNALAGWIEDHGAELDALLAHSA